MVFTKERFKSFLQHILLSIGTWAIVVNTYWKIKEFYPTWNIYLIGFAFIVASWIIAENFK